MYYYIMERQQSIYFVLLVLLLCFNYKKIKSYAIHTSSCIIDLIITGLNSYNKRKHLKFYLLSRYIT